MPHAVGGVEHVQCAECEHRQRDAEDHHDRLQEGGRGAVARIDGGGELQAGRCGAGKVGEDADDLRPEVVTAAFPAARLVGIGGAVRIGICTEPDEFAGDLIGVRGERQPLTCGTQHRRQRRAHHRGVPDDDEQVGPDALDEQSAVDGLRGLLGDRRQQHVRRTGQPGGGAAGDRDVQLGRDVPDEGCVDALQDAVLWPVQLSGGLRDGKQGRGHREHGAQQSGDDGDETRGPVIGSRVGHGARC